MPAAAGSARSPAAMATASRRRDEAVPAAKPPPPPPLSQPPPPPPTLAGDWSNLGLLLFLYTLQGLPMGLASSVPLFLQARGASMSDQATFGLSSWPYSLKLCWAPIVDALHTRRWRLGPRKSRVVPIQLAAGVIMAVLGARLDAVFGGPPEGGAASEAARRIDVGGLTAAFFLLYFLVATQDIAVDGWALSLLRPENVGHASTANAAGQGAGVMMAYGLLMALDSPAFCDAWVRAPLGWPRPQPPRGLVTMAGFMQFWGYFFIAATLALWVWKREAAPTGGAGGGGGGGEEEEAEVAALLHE
jgi:PAT family acetyl-CoA transporter-like MFS transporter 1